MWNLLWNRQIDNDESNEMVKAIVGTTHTMLAIERICFLKYVEDENKKFTKNAIKIQPKKKLTHCSHQHWLSDKCEWHGVVSKIVLRM